MRRATNWSRNAFVLCALCASFPACGDDAGEPALDANAGDGGDSGAGSGGRRGSSAGASGRDGGAAGEDGSAIRGGTAGEGGTASEIGSAGRGGSARGGTAGERGGAARGGTAEAGGTQGESGTAGEVGTAGEASSAGHGGAAGQGGAVDPGGAAGQAGAIAHAGAGGSGDSGAGGQAGEAGGCSAGHTEVDGACTAICAPRDFDGANIALGLGHSDVIAVAYDADESQLELFVSDDSFPIRQAQPVRRTPESVLVHGKPTALLEVPDIPALSGIFEPGTSVWVLPEAQPEAEAGGLVWPGFQTYGVAAGELGDDRLIARLVSQEGAGRFVGFGTVQDETTPPVRHFDLLDAIDELGLPVGTHFHMNWAFTEGGVQRLRFELEATTIAGTSVTSEAHTYRFFFGELAELPATEPTVVVAEGLNATYAEGSEMQLSAVRYGAASTLPAFWARQCAGESGAAPGPWEPAGEGEQLTTTVQAGCQYLVCLVNGATVRAISQAVSPRVQ